MTAGFALGPLLAGLMAQWLPAPRVFPYLPHIAFMVGVLVLLRKSPETIPKDARRSIRLSVPAMRSRRFARVVAPMAPWTFTAPAIAFALLPSCRGDGRRSPPRCPSGRGRRHDERRSR